MEYLDSREWRYATKKFDRLKKVDNEVLQRISKGAKNISYLIRFSAIKNTEYRKSFFKG